MKIKNHFLLLVLMCITWLAAGERVFPVSAGDDNPRILQISPNGQGRAHAVAYSPDGSILAIGSSLGINIFNSSDLQPERFIPTGHWVRALSFSPDGSMLASGSYDPVVRLWRVWDGNLLKELSGHTAWVRSLTFSPNGDLLATASDDSTVRLWNLPAGNLFLVLDKGTQGVRTLSFSPDGTILATGGYDKIIRLWQVSDGTLIRELKGHEDWVRALAFSPNGKWLASGGFDATVRIWQVADGELVVTREEHTSSVLGLSFSPDGELLASASVDTTVRLWKMPSAEPYGLLEDHTDFVFSVAFSPDGKELASGSVDNTVRLWEVEGMESLTQLEEEATSVEGTTQSCVVCHHPRGNFTYPSGISQPPRVLDVSCSTCHHEGALVLNWCPAFARSPGTLFALSVAQPVLPEKIGIPQENQNISVVIASPGNGEHFYSPRIITAMPISGRVYYKKGDVTDVDVRLEIWSGSERVFELTTRPKPDGYFTFITNLSSDNIKPEVPTEKLVCTDCHADDLGINSYLPEGEVRLHVIAQTPDGARSSDQRWIYVDHSRLAIVNLQVEQEEDDDPVSGLPIQASTRLYEWRARNFNASTDEQGYATVQVEALAEVPTRYTFSLKPVVVDGILYESIEPVEVVLAPGAISESLINMPIRVTKGHISGKFTPSPGNRIGVLAYHLPDGTAFRTESSPEGAFTFSDLPIGRYLVIGDPDTLYPLDMVSQTQVVDLFQQPNESIELSLQLLSGGSLSGRVHQAGGEPIPFAFVSLDMTSVKQAVQPDTGRFALAGVPPEDMILTVSAPGFFSQAYVVNAKNTEPIDFSLVRRKETRSLSWGSGQVLLPPETQVIEEGLHLTLVRGWLWGHGESGHEPLRISLEAGEIQIGSGRFALEIVPGKAAWFFLFEGQANLRIDGDSQPTVISGKQMVILEEGFQPVPIPYDPTVVGALNQWNELPITLTWQPSLNAQVRDRLAQVGISTAQFMTFITYLMAFLTLLVVPVLVVNWLIKNRQARKHD